MDEPDQVSGGKAESDAEGNDWADDFFEWVERVDRAAERSTRGAARRAERHRRSTSGKPKKESPFENVKGVDAGVSGADVVEIVRESRER